MEAADLTPRSQTAGVRLRQLGEWIRHRLSFVPALYVVAAVGVAELLLWVDRQVGGDDVPDFLVTTADSARAVFQVVAGGLITAITLVLSMTLITVQLASSQMSPRTLRNWIGDRIVQHTIGVALGTTAVALVALQSVGGEDPVPHLTVTATLAATLVALFMLVGSVDHIANSVRIGAVAERIVDETASTIAGSEVPESPSGDRAVDSRSLSSDDAQAVTAGSSGWVQQIDVPAILAALPAGAQAEVAVEIGSFVPRSTPLLWVAAPSDPDGVDHDAVGEGFALGDTRTLQQDVSFGLVQLSDIAVRALSSGVNDPGTAEDVVGHLGDLLLRLWERPAAPTLHEQDGRTVVFPRPTHEDHLRTAFDPIRRYGSGDPGVMTALATTLASIASEVRRRDLPGPVEPLQRMGSSIAATAETEQWSAAEGDGLERALEALQVGSGSYQASPLTRIPSASDGPHESRK